MTAFRLPYSVRSFYSNANNLGCNTNLVNARRFIWSISFNLIYVYYIREYSRIFCAQGHTFPSVCVHSLTQSLPKSWQYVKVQAWSFWYLESSLVTWFYIVQLLQFQGNKQAWNKKCRWRIEQCPTALKSSRSLNSLSVPIAAIRCWGFISAILNYT